ncbi:alpha-galactosidase [Georgenia sp. TF02-10]|uniref:alpha-galactosidase n=1 Tax=Georgenia sp. TF02-10 TaxID=2917725 RepID=UPI001FA6B831|nr:alpha-galactosidase [Georgenia sp. TF02-10]UNX55802.1 alpha-galactosidase [Georgenia sp. TF02-10]
MLETTPLHMPDDVVEHRSVETLDIGTRESRVLRCAMRALGPDDGRAVVTSDLPTVRLQLLPGPWHASWFASDWGDEFLPRTAPVEAPMTFGVRTGRSSKGIHPWIGLVSAEHGALVVAPAWSGNWTVHIDGDATDGFKLTAGISSWRFHREVSRDVPFSAPAVYLAWGDDLDEAGAALATAVHRWVVPESAWTHTMPVEWNHWWPYEDAEIDAETFVANAVVARDLGLDVATLDAGWFGRPDTETFWERERGDWDRENTARFPGGLVETSRRVHELGLGFGVWIEAEAIGPDAQVRRDLPGIQARRDDDPPGSPLDPNDPGWLGYVCLGSIAGREHVRGVLDRLVARTGARWLKLDFNLDPGAGCSRTDHGHGSGDGLYEHYRGLYGLLDELRTAHPNLLLEACSSGGLRIDLGLLSRVHCAFLSDPDWTEFHLQLLWGAARMLPARAVLHWSESQWRGFHPCQNLDLASLDAPTFDQALRAVMLHRFGVSYRLVDLSAELRRRLAQHLTTYRDEIAPLVRAGAVIRPLTDQPLRQGGGERFPAFQLDGSETKIVAAFRLDGAPEGCTLAPRGLDPAARWRLTLLGPAADPADVPLLEGHTSVELSGAELIEGLRIDPQGQATSWLIRIDAPPPAPRVVPDPEGAPSATSARLAAAGTVSEGKPPP